MVKDRSCRTFFINLYPGRRGQLVEPRAVQRYSHTPGTRKMIRQTNFVFVCLFYRLCQQQEQIQQERTKILPQRHHKSQRLYKLQCRHHQFQTIYLQGHFRVFLASPLTRFGFGWTMDMTAKNRFCIEDSQILRSGAS